MVRTRTRASARRGVAVVELAVLLPFLLVVLLGIWEVGRLIEVQQILNNAAREGARIAAQGQIINQTSAPTQIQVNSGTPDVYDTVKNYLTRAGIDTTGMQLNFAFTSGNTALTDPYQATKGQSFQVTVSIPFNNVRWTVLSLTNITQLSATVVWQSLVDDPFTINTTLPSW
ncbi:MAG TPA: TadE family protein [Gemmataceae bacterium]|nr:TadE family protein [Gemmataceae bacterium]